MSEARPPRTPDLGTPRVPIFWDWDVAADVMTWSSGIEALIGRSVSETPRSRAWWEEHIVAADCERVRNVLAKALGGSEARVDVSYRVRVGAEGSVQVVDRFFAVQLDGRVHRLVGVIQPADSPLVTAPERVPQSESQFETFVQSLPLLAWETDPAGWIYYYNQRWYDYTGTLPADMEGWGWVSVHDPLDLPRMLRVFRNAILSGEPWEDEFRLRRGSDGALRWHLSRAVPIRDESGHIVRWFGSNVDIHDQKLALEEREKLLRAEQLLRREAERVSREKDEFLAIVSHELRTPLSALSGWVQVLRESPMPSEAVRPIEKVERATTQLTRLIDDLLDVSRIISGKLSMETSAIDAGEAVARAIEATKASADAKGIVLMFRRPEERLLVTGNAERLEQIAVNLLSNAVKFSPSHGSVEITMEAVEHEVTLTVKDGGEGIDEEVLPFIFDRFRQADSSTTRRYGGLGLGLAIVDHLVALHGGSVHAHSDGKDRGACFSVRLPRSGSTDPVHQPAYLAAAAEPTALTALRVLVVDDHLDTREALAAVLLGCGATVSLAGSVAEALVFLRATEVDAIVSDISMPEIDGYGLVHRVRGDARFFGIPVLALTAHASEQDRARALSSGFDAYLPKPFDAARLSRILAELVRLRSTGV